MEKVIINGKEYQLDVEKCKKQGLLVEKEKWYPKNWDEFVLDLDTAPAYTYSARVLDKCKHGSYDEFDTEKEARAFIALGKLIQLRDWWWNNMCDGWRPDWKDNTTKYVIYIINDKFSSTWLKTQYILAFPNEKIGDKFFETYRDLIEEAKMFL